MRNLLIVGSLLLPPLAGMAGTPAVNSLLDEYTSQGASAPDAGRGQQLWITKHVATTAPMQRSCADCHSSDLRNKGKHVRTGKAIEPLAPSVNSNSLNDARNIKKWLKRNCKWTLGRECSAQEKSDILVFIGQQ